MRPNHLRWRLIIAALVAGLILVPACSPTRARTVAAVQVPAPPPMPSWIASIVPAPGSSDSGVQAVEVKDRLTPPQYSRLKLDGVDVTIYSRKAPGYLHYDSGSGPVTLNPGLHTGEVDRMLLVPNGPDTVIEAYAYKFRTE